MFLEALASNTTITPLLVTTKASLHLTPLEAKSTMIKVKTKHQSKSIGDKKTKQQPKSDSTVNKPYVIVPNVPKEWPPRYPIVLGS